MAQAHAGKDTLPAPPFSTILTTMLQGWDPTWTVRRIDAKAAIDGRGCAADHASGVSAVIERGPAGTLTLAALGPTDEVASSSRWAGVASTDRRHSLLLPGLVNAHTHLDLTHIGPRPHDPAAGFAAWIGMILRARLNDEPSIAAAIGRGVELSLAGGTVLIGDISGAVGGLPSPFAGRALAGDGRVNGVAYLEFFAQGAKADKNTVSAAWNAKALAGEFDAMTACGRVVSGIQPHAIYSVGVMHFLQVLANVPDDMPTCSHIAESLAEKRFVAEAAGPFVDMLRTLNLWDDSDPPPGLGESPIDVLMGHGAADHRIAAVHVNDVDDDDLHNLTAAQWPVIYCPRSSSYFGAHRDFGPHRYRDMLAAGITVALGTDSIVNLDTPDRISVWDEMRLLHQRDGTDPLTLLKLASINGAAALRRETAPFTLTPLGSLAGLVAIQVPNANPNANSSELLTQALGPGATGGRTSAADGPELLAIGRV